MKGLKRIGERMIELLLFSSSTVSIITVFLIILFLFKEGISFFDKTQIKAGSEVIVSTENNISILQPGQLRSIFQQEYTNWNQLGGSDLKIVPVTISDISSHLHEGQSLMIDSLPWQIQQIMSENPGMVGVFPPKYLTDVVNFRELKFDNVSIKEIFEGENWYPTSEPEAEFGILPLIMGTLWVAFGAILFALPVGLAASIYLAEIASLRFRNILKPVIELLAGIPSVVFGFFGLAVVVPQIQKMFDLPVGDSALAGSFILGIMALPTIITISEDALRNTPRSMREAS